MIKPKKVKKPMRVEFYPKKKPKERKAYLTSKGIYINPKYARSPLDAFDCVAALFGLS